MGYMALCIGRRDLAGSVPFLLEETKKKGLRPISSNLRYKGKAVFDPYVIFNIDGIKIGVLAVTSPMLSQKIKTDGVEVLDPSERLKALVPELSNKVRIVVLLSDLGEHEDRKLASAINGIDIIIGSGPGPQRRQSLKENNTNFLRTHPKGKSIGKMDIELDADGGIRQAHNSLVVLSSRFPEDETASKRLQELKKKYGQDKTGVTKAGSKNNALLKALQDAQKKKGQGQQGQGGNQTDQRTNMLIELLKKQIKAQSGSSRTDSSLVKPASEVKGPESSPKK